VSGFEPAHGFFAFHASPFYDIIIINTEFLLKRCIIMRRKDREITNIPEIEAIIKKCKICHVAMVDKGTPYVIPLNFAYVMDGDILSLYFHSAKVGRKLEILKEDNKVCFEMACEGKLGYISNPCSSGYNFESVLGFGEVEFIEDIEEKSKILTLFVKQQSDQDFAFTEKQASSVCVYKIVSKDFTGKIKPRPNESTM
jgi:nitroimidazol reductase NimA-like FMN-containing flavoprotein (pyridoxamine 5'-phosphate oxidase superfamily)